MRHRLAWYGIILCLWSSGFSQAAESKPAWQAEWERTVKAAEEEGQLTVYIAGYGALIDSGMFQKAYPKIKVTSVTGSGTQLAPRIVAERRGEKYLADVYSGGGGSIYQSLYLGKMLDPLKPALILPEVIDPTKWWEGKQRYADREGRYIIVYEANVAAGASPAYNSNLINPKDYKSLWDFLNPKLKGKIVSPRSSAGARFRAVVPVSLLPRRSRPGVSAPFLRRDGCYFDRRRASGDGLAGGR